MVGCHVREQNGQERGRSIHRPCTASQRQRKATTAPGMAPGARSSADDSVILDLLRTGSTDHPSPPYFRHCRSPPILSRAIFIKCRRQVHRDCQVGEFHNPLPESLGCVRHMRHSIPVRHGGPKTRSVPDVRNACGKAVEDRQITAASDDSTITYELACPSHFCRYPFAWSGCALRAQAQVPRDAQQDLRDRRPLRDRRRKRPRLARPRPGNAEIGGVPAAGQA